MAPAPLTLFGVRHRTLIALMLAMLTFARKKMAWSCVLGVGRGHCLVLST
jgi:hypothetical protein